MTMKLQLATLGFLCCVMGMAHSQRVKVKDCSAPGNKVLEANIYPCPNQPCEFPTGSNVTVNVTYKLGKNAKCEQSLTTKISFYPDTLEGLEDFLNLHGLGHLLNPSGPAGIPYPIPNPNTCNFLNPPCPICPGNTTVFYDHIEIPSSFPKIPGTIVEGKKVDKDGKTVFCFTFRAKVV